MGPSQVRRRGPIEVFDHHINPWYGTPVIQVHRLTVRFSSGLEALRDVSMSVNEGEFAFVSGRSGAGKSTLLAVICAELAPTDGQVIVAGRNLAVLKRAQVPYLRRSIGRLWQDVRLLPELSVRDNVSLPLEVLGVDAARRKRRVDQVLEMVGMERHANALPQWLSTLEQQRVGIARAVAHEPAILLADEPTGNLDPEGGREIIQMLRDLQSRGLTTIVATRDSNLATSYPERVVLLNKGFLIEDGAPLGPADLPSSREVSRFDAASGSSRQSGGRS